MDTLLFRVNRGLMRAAFSSERERWLWASTVAVVAAIYSTLGLARVVVDELSERDLLPVAVVLGVILVLSPVAWRWAKSSPSRSDLAVATAVAFAYWMVWVRMESWAERTHLVEYGIVAGLIHMAVLERVRNGRHVPAPAMLAVGATAILGLVDECVQAAVPGRVFDFRDVFFNTFAGFMVVSARLAIGPQRGPGWRMWFLWLWATAIGWGQGIYFGWYSDDEPVLIESTPDVILAGCTGLLAGASLTGLLQWLVLRRHLDGLDWWPAATTGATALCGVVVLGVGLIDVGLGWTVGVCVVGTAAGMAQWVILRSHVPRAGWWVLASTAGWAAGVPFGDINGPPGLGAAQGAVTATALVWLLRRSEAGAGPAVGRRNPHSSRIGTHPS